MIPRLQPGTVLQSQGARDASSTDSWVSAHPTPEREFHETPSRPGSRESWDVVGPTCYAMEPQPLPLDDNCEMEHRRRSTFESSTTSSWLDVEITEDGRISYEELDEDCHLTTAFPSSEPAPLCSAAADQLPIAGPIVHAVPRKRSDARAAALTVLQNQSSNSKLNSLPPRRKLLGQELTRGLTIQHLVVATRNGKQRKTCANVVSQPNLNRHSMPMRAKRQPKL